MSLQSADPRDLEHALAVFTGVRPRLFAIGEVGEIGDRFTVTGVAGGDCGGGAEFDVRVNGDVAFVAVKAAVAGLVSVPGLRVHSGGDPAGVTSRAMRITRHLRHGEGISIGIHSREPWSPFLRRSR
jgi:hypothetical protein